MMSEERWQYLERSSRRVSSAASPTAVSPDLDEEELAFQRWLAEERRQELLLEIERTRARDPNVARALQEQLDADEALLATAPAAESKPYDPARLYSRMAHYYTWTYDYMDEMDYTRFFSAAREMFIALHEEHTPPVRPVSTASDEGAHIHAEAQLYASVGPEPEVWPGISL